MSARDDLSRVGRGGRLNRDWAHRIIAEWKAGNYTCNYGIDLAHEVLGLERDREAEAERKALRIEDRDIF